MEATPRASSTDYAPCAAALAPAAVTVRESRDASPPKPPRLLDRLREAMCARNYSPRTTAAYAAWVRRFILHHGKKHPLEMGEVEVGGFLTSLAASGVHGASSQEQALCALIFLYRSVLGRELGRIRYTRAAPRHRDPAIPTRDEIRLILDHLTGPAKLMAGLMYGAGLRLMECCRLRVMDLDLSGSQLVVRAGKGNKDRTAILPAPMKEPLRRHLQTIRAQYERDRAHGGGWVVAPPGARDRQTEASRDWGRQWLFPAARTYKDPATGQRRRHHFHPTSVQRAVREASLRAGLQNPATCHALRHSFAAHLVEDGHPLETVSSLLGHTDLGTTLRYGGLARRIEGSVWTRGSSRAGPPIDREISGKERAELSSDPRIKEGINRNRVG